MSKRPLTGLAVGVGCLALSLTAGAGVASATPDIGPMVNTTCTYDQAMRAVHAENPMAAQYLDQSPPNLQFLQTFMASSPDQRVNLLKAIQNNPGADQAFPIFKQMMTDCKDY
jgi:hemophore-related protein